MASRAWGSSWRQELQALIINKHIPEQYFNSYWPDSSIVTRLRQTLLLERTYCLFSAGGFQSPHQGGPPSSEYRGESALPVEEETAGPEAGGNSCTSPFLFFLPFFGRRRDTNFRMCIVSRLSIPLVRLAIRSLRFILTYRDLFQFPLQTMMALSVSAGQVTVKGPRLSAAEWMPSGVYNVYDSRPEGSLEAEQEAVQRPRLNRASRKVVLLVMIPVIVPLMAGAKRRRSE